MSKQTKRFLQENTMLEKKLTKENQDIMTDLVCYIRASNISMYYQEQVRSDLINMLLDGQLQNRTAYEIFGDDFKQFCDAIIGELPPIDAFNRILITLGHVFLYTSILGAILLVKNSISALMNGVFPQITIHLSDIFTMALVLIISISIVQYICKASIKDTEKRKVGILLFSGIGLVLLAFCLSLFLFPNISISTSFYILLPALAALYIGSWVIDILFE